MAVRKKRCRAAILRLNSINLINENVREKILVRNAVLKKKKNPISLILTIYLLYLFFFNRSCNNDTCIFIIIRSLPYIYKTLVLHASSF